MCTVAYDHVSVELGVANVYLEEEVRLLESYGFFKKHVEKYRTRPFLFLRKRKLTRCWKLCYNLFKVIKYKKG